MGEGVGFRAFEGVVAEFRGLRSRWFGGLFFFCGFASVFFLLGSGGGGVD